MRIARTILGAPCEFDASPGLEARQAPAAPPRLAPAPAREDGTAHEVGAPEAGFAAFLDGVQDSRVVAWLPSGIPVVLATIGAVILERVDRRLVAWGRGATVRRTFVLPRALCDRSVWDALAAQAPITDSGGEAPHPDSLLASAVECVESLRGVDERALAERWAAEETRPLWADGSVTGLGSAGRSEAVVGVVKSHRTLYADASALPALFALPVGWRTPVLTLAPADRAPAWTWYVRLRAASLVDPLHGLVRVECAPRDGPASAVADTISRWVLVERTPIALPDARWDVMAYGVARCEAYLKRGLALRASPNRP